MFSLAAVMPSAGLKYRLYNDSLCEGETVDSLSYDIHNVNSTVLGVDNAICIEMYQKKKHLLYEKRTSDCERMTTTVEHCTHFECRDDSCEYIGTMDWAPSMPNTSGCAPVVYEMSAYKMASIIGIPVNHSIGDLPYGDYLHIRGVKVSGNTKKIGATAGYFMCGHAKDEEMMNMAVHLDDDGDDGITVFEHLGHLGGTAISGIVVGCLACFAIMGFVAYKHGLYVGKLKKGLSSSSPDYQKEVDMGEMRPPPA